MWYQHYGKTPLMMAIDEGMVAVAALMVEKGANLANCCTVRIHFTKGSNALRRVWVSWHMSRYCACLEPVTIVRAYCLGFVAHVPRTGPVLCVP